MAEYKDIIDEIKRSVAQFTKSIPASQRAMYDAVIDEINRLDQDGSGNIKSTVKNLSILASIKNKLTRVVLTDEYKSEVKQFVKSFNTVTTLSNDYWRGLESEFSPRPLLKAIRKQAITDTIGGLTEAGITANVVQPIANMLNANATTGGSYKQLAQMVRDNLLPVEGAGSLDRYANTYAKTAINTYSAQYNNVVSSDLGYQWFRYDNSEIETSRPFCQAMCEPGKRFFHISEIPRMLKGIDRDGSKMRYIDFKTNEEKTVEINPKTDLPDGFIKGTDASNFLVVRAGYNCGHQCRPTNVRNVPKDVVAAVEATAAYKSWAAINDPDALKKPEPKPEPKPQPTPPPAAKGPQPVGTPVSSHFKNVSPTIQKPVETAMSAIDEVHGDGVLKDIPIVSSRKKNSYGYFRWGGGQPVEIGIKNGSPHPELTHAHEMGHYLDFYALGEKGKYSTTTTEAGKNLIKVIQESETVKTINKAIKEKKVIYKGEEIRPSAKYLKHLRYLASSEELFARAYAQFIAKRSSNFAMKVQLGVSLSDDDDRSTKAQWNDKDFEKIDAALEALFIEKGWMKK